jgi:hypothetical protein
MILYSIANNSPNIGTVSAMKMQNNFDAAYLKKPVRQIGTTDNFQGFGWLGRTWFYHTPAMASDRPNSWGG